jgi:hypothetical protein
MPYLAMSSAALAVNASASALDEQRNSQSR